jgi:hypothetical protein
MSRTVPLCIVVAIAGATLWFEVMTRVAFG